jgi:hypothetical protein
VEKSELEELLWKAKKRLETLDLCISLLEEENSDHSYEGFSNSHYNQLIERREKLEEEIEGYRKQLKSYNQTPSTFD